MGAGYKGPDDWLAGRCERLRFRAAHPVNEWELEKEVYATARQIAEYQLQEIERELRGMTEPDNVDQFRSSSQRR